MFLFSWAALWILQTDMRGVCFSNVFVAGGLAGFLWFDAHWSGAFQQFQNSYFDEPGSDLLAYTPADYTPTPANFVPGVQNQQVRKWALQIHALWLILARQTAATVAKQPDQHTLLPVPQPFIIPGDRFREVYYWDSYWIIRWCTLFCFFSLVSDCLQNGFVRSLLRILCNPLFSAFDISATFENKKNMIMVWTDYFTAPVCSFEPKFFLHLTKKKWEICYWLL